MAAYPDPPPQVTDFLIAVKSADSLP
nr:hypothetical protein [Chitinophaga pinensis]